MRYGRYDGAMCIKCDETRGSILTDDGLMCAACWTEREREKQKVAA